MLDMTSTGKTTTAKYAADVQTTQSPSGLGGGHKASFKSTKLARRARSFKDDFLGKISQMRSPTGQIGGRSHSPKSHSKLDMLSTAEAPATSSRYQLSPGKDPVQELNHFCKQIQVALKHLRDVISKGKLEMLSGNGTVVLDTVWHINLAVKSLNTENSNSITSATSCMYQSVARLIKLCDDVLIDNKSSELNESNVKEIVDQVEEAVKNLITLAQEKIQHKSVNSERHYINKNNTGGLDVPQRNSLPDIPLSPREREILEKTSCSTGGEGPAMRNSRSTESILRDPSPPPKPPLPDRSIDVSSVTTPPPLPPKKKNRLRHISDDFSSDLYGFSSPIANSFERVSLRSKSPEDSFSLLSESGGSIDSMLNQSSRDEDNEIKAIMDDDDEETDFGEGEQLANLDMDFPDFGHSGNTGNSWEESSLSSTVHVNSSRHYHHHHTSVNDYHRLSNTDSGISSLRFSNYSKRSSQQSSISTTTKSYQQDDCQSAVEGGQRDEEEEDAPPIPQKTRKKPAPPPPPPSIADRQPSPYDNVAAESDKNCAGQFLVTCRMHQSHQSSSSTSISSSTVVDSTVPPPLPPKKKHMFQSVAYSVMAYMEMFGNCSHVNDQEFMRHSVHMVQSNWMQPNKLTSGSATLPTTQSCSFSHHYQQHQQHHHSTAASTTSASISTSTTSTHHSSSSRHTQHSTLAIPLSSSSASHSPIDRTPSPIIAPATPPALPPKQRTRKESSKGSCSSPPPTPTAVPATAESAGDNKQPPSTAKAALPDLLEHTAVTAIEDNKSKEGINRYDVDLMEELNVDEYLVRKKKDEEGPEIRGGAIDALIIQATKATKNGVFAYQEAFLTTYRTFIKPMDLINKLIRRYNHFYYQPEKKPRSREAFALIVRVVSDLTASDLDDELQQILMRFVQQLIECGELTLAKALRVKHLERQEAKMRNQRNQITNVTSSVTLIPREVTLLSFKSDHLAEQMTLLDAELFMKIEIPEVLIWAQEQNEERSPNLTKFTEHFNKMSYWARTRLLTAETKEVREKYFLKFIKVMKHLRKINNFNSYLALLSALDSAPIRRLEWQKHVQEGLKEYCALIDSSSSFRAYRQALAETQPPCIPYIGLVLQDLTFVHIGNSNTLPDGSINFTKRWQQFNIVENMKKFKLSSYTFKKNEKIIEFFQNFDDCIGEDAMWQLSETIKPRGGKKINT